MVSQLMQQEASYLILESIISPCSVHKRHTFQMNESPTMSRSTLMPLVGKLSKKLPNLSMLKEEKVLAEVGGFFFKLSICSY